MKSTYLVNILIFESSWATKSCREVFVKRVRAPEDASSALKLDIIHIVGRIAFPPAIQAYGKNKM